ncbi:hypothetical protein ACXYTJ_01535 [Gilvimarinus sp. F26214L]|uniref:hypothetical protein n=1 Tax=Gilvimarinus sp. DZF01 TaxID=3461371 RepID=UPI0040461065
MNLFKYLVPAFLTLFLFGCDQGPAEQAGEDIDEAVEDTGESLEDAGDEAEDTFNQ